MLISGGRNIPAHAGKTELDDFYRNGLSRNIPAHAGKTELDDFYRNGLSRNIPAHAGKTRHCRFMTSLLPEHPRARGENTFLPSSSA